MVFNPRAGEVADGAITTAKLAASAVTSAKIAADAVTTTQIATDAVTSAKIAANAVLTAKIADGQVTTLKAVDALRRKDLVGSEVNLTHTGTARKRVERLKLSKDASRSIQEMLFLIAALVNSGTGTVEVWFDNDADWDGSDLYTGAASPAASVSVTATTSTVHMATADMSGLANGKHVVNISFKGSAAGTQLDSDLREYLVKE